MAALRTLAFKSNALSGIMLFPHFPGSPIPRFVPREHKKPGTKAGLLIREMRTLLKIVAVFTRVPGVVILFVIMAFVT
ncbi:hypothetical protein MUP29_05520, partial [bacterium]|nr:hypothetical protein [bacterium]